MFWVDFKDSLNIFLSFSFLIYLFTIKIIIGLQVDNFLNLELKEMLNLILLTNYVNNLKKSLFTMQDWI